MTHSPQTLLTLAARWYLFTKMLIAFGRQMVKLQYTGATAALDKAERLNVMAQLALQEALCEHAKIRTLPKSKERDALLQRLEVSAHILVMMRAVALSVLRGPSARSKMIGAMALDFGFVDDAIVASRADDVATIDSS